MSTSSIAGQSASPLLSQMVSRSGEIPEARHRSILKALPAAVYTCDAEGRVTEFNDAAAQLWGRRPELGRDLWCGSWRIYYPDGSAMPLEECPMALALRKGHPVRGREIIVERPDGTRRWVMPFPDPLRDESGEIVGAVNMLVDITDQRYLQERLRDNQQHYRDILGLMPAAVYICQAPQGKITFYNRRAAELWGREPALGDDEDRFCGAFRLYRADGSPVAHVDTPMGEVLRGGPPVRDQEVILERPDGSRVTVVVNIDPILDSRGQLVGAVNVFQDHTERKRGEEALRRSEQELRDLFDNAAIGVHWVGPDGTILRANRAELEMLGYSESEYIGRHVSDFHVDRPVIDDILCRLKSGQTLRGAQARLRCRDGSIRHVLIDSNVRWQEGRFIHTRCFTRDVTDQVRAEEALRELNAALEDRVTRRTRDLEERTGQLRQLALQLTDAEQRERKRLGAILHDHLQQLLVAARMRLSAAASGQDGPLGEALAAVSELVDDSIRAARDLTLELRPPVLYEGGLVPALRWLSRWMAEHHGLEVCLELQGAAPSVDDKIGAMIFESVRELLLNTVKHAGVKSASVAVAACESGLCIAVSDQGCGFDPASRMGNKAGSTGFGMFAIQERITALGGTIEMDSHPGQGTRVKLVVPTELDPGAASPRTHTPSAHTPVLDRSGDGVAQPTDACRQVVRVLLVDDHKIVREGIANLLTQEPRVRIVAQGCDGQEAVDLAEQLRPDVIVLDVNMPRLNGVEAARIIHGRWPQIRIVGLSVQDEAEIAQSMYEAGADDYVNKSGDPSRLIAAVLNGVV